MNIQINCTTLLKSFLSVCFLNVVYFSHAQVNIINNTINGSPIISSSIKSGSDNTGIGIGAVATPNACYWLDSTGKPHTFLGSDDPFVDIEFKNLGDSFQLLVLQSSGKATLAKATRLKNGIITYSYTHFKSADSSAISKSFEKIAGDDVYVLSTNGFYVTRDLGKTWQWDTTGLNGDRINDFVLDKSQNVLAVGNKGVYAQTPTGKSWAKSAIPGVSSLAKIFIDRTGRMLVSTNSFKGVYISADGGKNWNIDTAGLGFFFINRFTDDKFGNLYAITSSGSGQTGLYKSAGGTGNWTEIGSKLRAAAGNTAVINTLFGDASLWAGTSFGLFKSNDQGQTWSENNDSIHPSKAFSLAKSSSQSVFVTTDLGLYRLNGNRNSWARIYPDHTYQQGLNVYTDGLGTLYTLDQQNSPFKSVPMVLKSTDNGNNWIPDTSGLSKVYGTLYFVDEKGVQHFGSTYYSSSSPSSLWQKPVGGSWATDNVNIPILTYSYFSAMGSDRQGNFYASGYMSGSINHNVMYSRGMSDTNWKIDTLGLESMSVSYITSGGKTGALAWNGNKIMRRTPGGWKPVPLPSSITFPGISAVSADSNSVIFAAMKDLFGSPVGVYYTKDTGKTWTYAGLAKTGIRSLVSYRDTTYVLTTGSWVYSLGAKPFHDNGIERYSEDQLGESIVYPNPAHNILTIKYNINNSAYFTIELFNTVGQTVAKYHNEPQQKGVGLQTLDISSLKPGIYLYKICAQEGQISQGRIVIE